ISRKTGYKWAYSLWAGCAPNFSLLNLIGFKIVLMLISEMISNLWKIKKPYSQAWMEVSL
ncbi:hypothetical protein, partial [Gibbsiella quercinecans]|uniref:hypothetical protein n=1 Tax=Gibbsiella quercinecans TaxID=929813 RepID=UPI001E55B5EA